LPTRPACLSSEETGRTTGQMLVIDGGIFLNAGTG
jgi:hypothetical protein